MAWHRMRRKEGKEEEERGCWKGISGWALTLGLFMLEKQRALSLLCCVYTQRAKGGLRLTAHPATPRTTPTRNSYTGRLRDKEGSAMFMSTEPCEKPFDVLLLFEGTAERLEDFWMWCQEQQARRQLCARGGGSAQESKMAGEERKTAYQRRGPT